MHAQTRPAGYQRIPPGHRFAFGHAHKQQEEVYVVAGGSGRVKLDDEIVELERWDVVRVSPGTWRGEEAGPDGLEPRSTRQPVAARDPDASVRESEPVPTFRSA